MTTRTFAFALLLPLLCAAAPPSPNDVRREMAFMCEWTSGRFPSDYSLGPCTPSVIDDMSPESLQQSMKSFWIHWSETSPSTTAKMKAEYARAYASKLAKGRPAHVYTAAELEGLPVEKVCALARSKGPVAELAIADLRRNTILTAAEISVIRQHTIQIGITQAALLCSWGEPSSRNRTVTADGERIQWRYGNTYVYTVNGVLTAWQD